MRSYIPSEKEWDSTITGIQTAIWVEVGDQEPSDPSIAYVRQLFVKILNEDFPEYSTPEPGRPFSKFDDIATYNDVERLFDIAIRYANNWAFS